MTNRFEISGYSDVGDYMMVTVLIFGDSTFMSRVGSAEGTARIGALI